MIYTNTPIVSKHKMFNSHFNFHTQTFRPSIDFKTRLLLFGCVSRIALELKQKFDKQCRESAVRAASATDNAIKIYAGQLSPAPSGS